MSLFYGKLAAVGAGLILAAGTLIATPSSADQTVAPQYVREILVNDGYISGFYSWIEGETRTFTFPSDKQRFSQNAGRISNISLIADPGPIHNAAEDLAIYIIPNGSPDAEMAAPKKLVIKYNDPVQAQAIFELIKTSPVSLNLGYIYRNGAEVPSTMDRDVNLTIIYAPSITYVWDDTSQKAILLTDFALKSQHDAMVAKLPPAEPGFLGTEHPMLRPADMTTETEIIYNAHTVVPGKIYRGGRPDDANGIAFLKSKGIKTIINLQGDDQSPEALADILAVWQDLATDSYHSTAPIKAELRHEIIKIEPGEAEELRKKEGEWAMNEGMAYYNLPLSGFSALTSVHTLRIQEALKIMNEPSQQPVFVHCERGSDRTGLVVALYLLAQNPGQHVAIKTEMDSARFGRGTLHRKLIGRAIDPYFDNEVKKLIANGVIDN